MLPPGVVCDRCNSGRLSDIDNAFLNFPPVSFMRTINGIATKAGKRPSSKWGNARITSPSDANIYIETNSNAVFRTVGPNKHELQLKTPRAITPADVAVVGRAVWKMALELAYLDHGQQMFDPRLDETRRMILGEEPAHGWLAWARKGLPSPSVSLQYWWPPLVADNGDECMLVLLSVYGMEVGTDLLKRVPAQPPPELSEQGDLHVF